MRVDASALPSQVVIEGEWRLTVITPSLIRLEHGAFTDDATQTVICRNFGEVPMKVWRDEGKLLLETACLSLQLDASAPLSEAVSIRGLGPCAFFWTWGRKPLQNLKGTTSTLDEVNGACHLEDGLCSRDGFAMLDDSGTARLTPDGTFAKRESCIDLYFFGYGHDYTQCVRDYYRLTGVPQLLPAFVFGNWWSRYHAYTAEEYIRLMDRFEEKDVPLSVAIVDMDWHLTRAGKGYFEDGWTGYTWNPELFPNEREFIQNLHDRDLKTALNLHPAMGVRPWDSQYEDMCRAVGQRAEEGRAVRFRALDPKFLKAYFEILHFPYERDGVDFWWMDWQQGTDWKPIEGEDWQETGLESITPLWLLNHTHYLASMREGKRGLIFSRYAGYGSQRYPIGFSGDTYITWESLDFQPYFTATASNVGYSWWSHDIGGHMGGIRDDELTVRWIQLGVFSPIFRLHSTDSPFLGREPWNYNLRAETVMTHFMRLRHRMFPYLYTMNRRTAQDLLPLVRPMYHVSPEAPEAYHVPNVYWFGSELVAAPVTHKADESDLGRSRVWLPEGRWIDAMNGYVYRGGRTWDVYRPLEEMPLFVKAGGIVPLQAHENRSRRLGGSQAMEVLVAPGADGAFTLYEDDGETLAYQRGEYALTRLSLNWEKDTQAVFCIAPVTGDLSQVPAVRSWRIMLRGFRMGTQVTVEGQSADARYIMETNTCEVMLEQVRADTGVTLTLTHPDGLMHDDGDLRNRILDRLMRAQGEQSAKARLLSKADAVIERLEKGETVKACRLDMDQYPSLGGYIRELMAQKYDRLID